MNDPSRLAPYVQPSLSEARIQSQWSRITEHQSRHSSWPVVWSLASVAAVSILVVFSILAYRGRVPAQLPGSANQQIVVKRNNTGRESVTFPEGLSITLKGEARYRVAERSSKRVHLLLERGTAEFDVTPLKERQVVVTAAGFDVEVVGTHFEVALVGQTNKPDVAVRVERGTVKVRPSGQQRVQEPIRTLNAGEAWSTRTYAPTAGKSEASAGDVPGTVGSADTQTHAPVVVATPPVQRAMTAKELFESAESARIGGRAREAAAALDRLRHAYPSDRRAGLASFELGRLRMDQLSDAPGAVNALTDALRLEPSARFREDALARLVQLYDRMGQPDRCRKAQAQYHTQYPSGPHAKGVLSLCAR